MIKHQPRVFLRFRLPDGTMREGFFRHWQKLGDILKIIEIEGRTELDQEKDITQLGLRNDDVIKIL